jgi:N-acetylglucosamine-6-phosphate deacetylase
MGRVYFAVPLDGADRVDSLVVPTAMGSSGVIALSTENSGLLQGERSVEVPTECGQPGQDMRGGVESGIVYGGMKTVIQARRLITGTKRIDYPTITVEDGRIAGMEAGDKNGSTETLTQRFFDIHVHGACSHDFMSATLGKVDEVGRFLSQRGVGHYLPTTVTGGMDATLRALETLADAIDLHRHVEGAGAIARPEGVHLEGPFVSHLKRGVHPEASILSPSLAVFDRFQEAARGNIRLMTIAPELPGSLELIRHAVAAGVRVSMGHSNATRAETLAAMEAGATTSTHLFNAMRPLDSREPGIVGTVLTSDAVYAELICDGVHVHPAMVQMWLTMKGKGRAILVTDGMSATGMPDGVYTLGDFPVEVKDGVCLSGKTLAGSVLTMDRAVENVQSFTGTSLDTAVGLASHNPATMLGMGNVVATAVGGPAEFNVFDERGKFTGTLLGGKRTRVQPA